MYKEETISINQLAGLGDNVVKIIKKDTDEVVCYIGKKEDKDFVFFQGVINSEDVITVAELLGKKKMQKALSKNDFEKAQKIANKIAL